MLPRADVEFISDLNSCSSSISKSNLLFSNFETVNFKICVLSVSSSMNPIQIALKSETLTLMNYHASALN
jgi:hypothetical protein